VFIARIVAVLTVLGFAFLAQVTTAAPVDKGATSKGNPSTSMAIDTKGLLHDPRLLAYRSPFGAVPAGATVTLRLRTAHQGASSVTLFHQQSSSHAGGHQALAIETRGKKFDVWRTSFIPKDVAVYTYDFLVMKGSSKRWYSDTAAAENTAGAVYKGTPDQQFHLTSYVSTFKTPAWARDAVYYQIFPDSFYNGDPSNDKKVMPAVNGGTEPTFYTSESDAPQGQFAFYGGDLQGIDDKLGYLKDLGVNTLYLNPIFLAPTNHKYDTSDYLTIDPHFGSMQTLLTLLADAHTAGLRVILDGVFNHTGNDSVYFNQYNRFPGIGAYQSQSSPYYSWYSFASWPGSVLTFPNAANMPQLNESDTVKNFIFRNPDSVAQHWLNAGTDGWRLDAATYKSHAWWQNFRTALKERFPEDVLVCECDLSPIDATPYLMGNEFDGVMNYRFRDLVLQFFARGNDSHNSLPASSTSFFNQLLAVVQEYPLPSLYASMNLVDSHDTGRILTSLRGSKAELKQVATFQATWLGAPSIYYGDEAGMGNAASPDPFYVSRQFYDWQHPDADMQSYYRSVLRIRQANPALRDGTITPLVLNNSNRIVSFLRRDVQESVVVAFNDDTKAHTVKLTLPGLRTGMILTDALSGTGYTVAGGTVTLKLRGTSAAILAPAPVSPHEVHP
jgi:cyclomaltodextrinase / maltogenic alpha-amylase / neopullulanase